MKKYITVAIFSLFFFSLFISPALADSELSNLTQQKNRVETLKQRIVTLIDLAENKNRKDVVFILQELLISAENILNRVKKEKDNILEEKVLEVLEKNIEFVRPKGVYTFEITPMYVEDAAANQLMAIYSRATTMENLKEVFIVAEKYGATVTGNRADLRVIQFHAANEDIVILMNDLKKISNIDAYLNMLSTHNGSIEDYFK